MKKKEIQKKETENKKTYMKPLGDVDDLVHTGLAAVQLLEQRLLGA